jgi:hypothetical protein
MLSLLWSSLGRRASHGIARGDRPMLGTWRDPKLPEADRDGFALPSRFCECTDEAILWFERARSAGPELPHVHAYLASAFALKGDTGRAAAELAEARRLSADDRYSSVARLQAAATVYFGVPKIHALYETTYLAGLRKAGMPEE